MKLQSRLVQSHGRTLKLCPDSLCGGGTCNGWQVVAERTYRFATLAIVDPFEVPDLNLNQHVGVLGNAAAENELQALIDGCIPADAGGSQLRIPGHLDLDSPACPGSMIGMQGSRVQYKHWKFQVEFCSSAGVQPGDTRSGDVRSSFSHKACLSLSVHSSSRWTPGRHTATALACWRPLCLEVTTEFLTMEFCQWHDIFQSASGD